MPYLLPSIAARRVPIRRPRRPFVRPVQTGPRVNRQIRLSPIRLIDETGENHGIIETHVALERAAELGLDLVEVAPDSRPPVCRIMDFGRYRYEQSRKEREQRRGRQKDQIHEITELTKEQKEIIDGYDE